MENYLQEHFFTLKVLTPTEKVFSGKAKSLSLPTQAGSLTILKNHSPLLAVVSIGQVKIVDDKDMEHVFLVQGGVLNIKPVGSSISAALMVDKRIDDSLPLDSIEQEIVRAREAMQTKSDYEFAEEESIIERNLFLKRLKR